MFVEKLIIYAVDFFINIFANITEFELLANLSDKISAFANALYGLLGTFFDIIATVYYFLPVDYLVPLFAIVFGVVGFRIIIALLRFVLEIIPG